MSLHSSSLVWSCAHLHSFSTSGKMYKTTQSLKCLFKSTCHSVGACLSACWKGCSPTYSGLAQFPYFLADPVLHIYIQYIPFSFLIIRLTGNTVLQWSLDPRDTLESKVHL